MESRILLSFLSSTGDTITITVPRGNPDVEDQVVKDCMDMLIDANIFSSTKGSLVSAKTARLISTTETPILL